MQHIPGRQPELRLEQRDDACSAEKEPEDEAEEARAQAAVEDRRRPHASEPSRSEFGRRLSGRGS